MPRGYLLEVALCGAQLGPLLKPDAGALRSWPEPAAPEHRAGFDLLFRELCNGIHQLLRRRALLFGMLDYHHESHRYISVGFGL